MEKNSNNSKSDAINIPLIGERSDSFTRRSTYIPSPETDYAKDENTLKEIGFDEAMIKKVYIFLKPRNIDEAIELMTSIDGIYQHDFYECRANSNNKLCFICKKERQFHIGENRMTIGEEEDYPSQRDSSQFRISDGTEKECLICLESFDRNVGIILQCGHFCCDNCFYNYLKTQINSAKVAKIQCFINDCDYVLNEDFILEKLKDDKALVDKYKVFKQRAEIFLSTDKKFCPEPDCNSYLQQSKDKYVQCENGHKYCYICLKKWHGKSPCDEELDKDFQIWKKDKVVKQCPRCKIYTEKNEGCNHMTCTECKYQWCWLCEGEYQEGHFRRGTCNGLQFAKINFLSEKDKVPKNRINYDDLNHYHAHYRRENGVVEYHYNDADRKKGCCICNSNIGDKLWFISHNGPFNLYYGNRVIMYIINLLCVLFFMVPVILLTGIQELGPRNNILRKKRMLLFVYLYAFCMFVSYQFLMSCLVIPVFILTLPIPSMNLLIVIWKKMEDEYGFDYY